MSPKKFAYQFAQKLTTRVWETVKEAEYRQIASKYDLNGYKRIYLAQIRKTGGTSLNNMFLSLSGKESGSLYTQLANTRGHCIRIEELIYVGWNVRLINKGNYFYGFSHTPLHKLDLPKETFTVSCFRDPSKRVISYYNMLMDFHVNTINHPRMAIAGKWLGESFDDFMDRIPREHLLNQLYMFSPTFNVNEAVRNVQDLSHYFFSDTFTEGIHQLNQRTGLELKPIHIRKAAHHAVISEKSLTRLRDMLEDEYKFLDLIRN